MASIAMKLLEIICFLSWGGSALAQGHVSAEVGSDVLLPCLFKPITDDEMVTWERKSANGSSAQVLVFDHIWTPRLPNIEWAGDLSQGDASIKISAVGMEDAGDYICETFYSDIKLSTTLSVVSKALAQGHISAEVGSDVLLPCLFNKPVPYNEMVTWERKLANGSSAQVLVFHDISTPLLPNIEWAGDLSRGDASVNISAVGIEDAGDYSCATFYSDINLSITLSVVLKVVEAPSRKNDNGNGEPTTGIILAAVALLVIAVAVVGFVIAMKMRGRRRSRDNESGTPPSTELQVLAPAASTA